MPPLPLAIFSPPPDSFSSSAVGYQNTPAKFANGLGNSKLTQNSFADIISKPVVSQTHSIPNDNKAKQKRTREYFNYAFGRNDQDVARTYINSITKGESIARQLATTFIEKNEWPGYGFDPAEKETFLSEFTNKIQGYERKYAEKVRNNPNDPNNAPKLLRDFNEIYGKMLIKKGWPVTLDEGLTRMLQARDKQASEAVARDKTANPNSAMYSDIPIIPPQTQTQTRPQTAWIPSLLRGWWWKSKGGRKTARSCIRSRNGKKNSACKLKRMSSKRVVCHRKSKRVRHIRRK